MPKRKLITLLLLWQVAGGSYLSPAEDVSQLTAWREMDPDAKIVFLRNWTSRGAAHELAYPRKLEMKDDGYCVVDAILSNETEYKIGKMTIKWIDDHLEYLGTRICDACFKVGKLSPVTCVKHVQCAHGRKDKKFDCLGCLSKTFAGHWAERVTCWHKMKNGGLRPWDVALQTHKKFWFTCRECGHDFDKSCDEIVGKDAWCPYCANQQRCMNTDCVSCLRKSFASHPKAQCWHISKNGMILPRHIALHDHKKYWFTCAKCVHDFDSSPDGIVSRDTWCPYCTNQKRCMETDCISCLLKSFASHSRAEYWHPSKNGIISPRQIALHDNKKYWFTCAECDHDFDVSPNFIVGQNQWCPYCANKKRCMETDCMSCLLKSFASHSRAEYWHPSKNGMISPRQIALHDNKKYWFTCEKCVHDFHTSPSDIVLHNCWCPYCNNRKRCMISNCTSCLLNSFASHVRAKCWHVSKNGDINPRQIALHNHEKFWFTCAECLHDFVSSPTAIAGRNSWCPYCAKQKRCDDPDCTLCAKSCEVCLSHKAYCISQKSRVHCCRLCLAIVIANDPKETPLSERAKISLEIYTLAELQSTAHETYFLAFEPTSWDCQILHNTNFAPDIMWAFDKHGNVFMTTGRCKIFTGEIFYILILEIIEESRERHSLARDVPDAEREIAIRHEFNFSSINVGVVYCTVAHDKHSYAAPEDVFFKKNYETNEYYVIEDRIDAWKVRVEETREALIKLYAEKSNGTLYIGG